MTAGRRSPRVMTPDDALRRYLDALRPRTEVDPLFRRRLRGTVLNRLVADREGIDTVPRSEPRRSMGALGRATLIATVALATSVGGVMAAAQSAVPGDVLYPLKRQIEQVRLDAAPAEYRSALEAQMLAERLAELSALMAAGDGARASALADAIVADGSATPAHATRAERHLAVLSALVERLPDGARDAISRSLDRAAVQEPGPGGIRERTDEAVRGSSGIGAGPGGPADRPVTPAEDPRRSAEPVKTATPTPRPSSSPTRAADRERPPPADRPGPKSR